MLVYIDDTQVKLKEEYNKKLEYLKNINEKITSINNFKAKKNIVTEKISELNEEYKNIANNLNLKVNSIVNYKINDEELNKKFDELVKTKTELDNFVSKTEVELNLLTIPVEFEYTIENLNLLIEKKQSLYSKIHLLEIIKEKIVNETSLSTQKYQKYLKDLEAWDIKRKQIIGELDGYPDGSLKHYKEEKEYLETNLETDLTKLYELRKEIISKIYDYYNKNCKILTDIYHPIEERLKNILELMEEKIKFDVQIVAEQNLNLEILNKVDQRINGFFYGKQSGIANLNNLITETNFNNKDSTIKFIEDIYNIVHNNVDDIDRLLNNKTLEFYNYIGSMEYLKSQYILKLGNKDLKQLSPGERGIVLLIFYLSLSKSSIPLIIDQPEDNLDNQSVYSKLVPCIKNAKKLRQIIIVTHNPNIAVACDSEQIIYCQINKKTNKISYSSGSIENDSIRNHVVDILEGTMPAFDLRKQKYN